MNSVNLLVHSFDTGIPLDEESGECIKCMGGGWYSGRQVIAYLCQCDIIIIIYYYYKYNITRLWILDLGAKAETSKQTKKIETSITAIHDQL